jgi:hypothetical protein
MATVADTPVSLDTTYRQSPVVCNNDVARSDRADPAYAG